VLKGRDEEPLRYFPLAQHSFGWVDGVSVKIMGKHRELSTAFSASINQLIQPLSILVRAETDDPWTSNTLSITLYTLQPNPDYTPPEISSNEPGPEIPSEGNAVHDMTSSLLPYLFPPVLTSKVSSRRGALRCKDIILGRLGTALWIQPKDQSAAGLYWTTDDAPAGPQTYLLSKYRHESLVATVFPGSLFSERDKEKENDEVIAPIPEQGAESEGKVICWNEKNNWSSIDYDEDVGRIVLGTSFGVITVIDM
jgi:hypothetical protein